MSLVVLKKGKYRKKTLLMFCSHSLKCSNNRSQYLNLLFPSNPVWKQTLKLITRNIFVLWKMLYNLDSAWSTMDHQLTQWLLLWAGIINLKGLKNQFKYEDYSLAWVFVFHLLSINIISTAFSRQKYVKKLGEFEYCAAEAIFYCPTMNSHRPKSQVT